ncbi:hypothetical protein SKAU_G00073670 [Synaphobranchus kaupii]|uniref:Uncharacterized protein n=1 Tax=Synaphobranchus kaupii TaxID=118154 RepID=A0A9Q1JBZ7_SYNKA|nr:hypothetical protein SKAU_G00073670 [Synaphobranchus kaupii]
MYLSHSVLQREDGHSEDCLTVKPSPRRSADGVIRGEDSGQGQPPLTGVRQAFREITSALLQQNLGKFSQRIMGISDAEPTSFPCSLRRAPQNPHEEEEGGGLQGLALASGVAPGLVVTPRQRGSGVPTRPDQLLQEEWLFPEAAPESMGQWRLYALKLVLAGKAK